MAARAYLRCIAIIDSCPPRMSRVSRHHKTDRSCIASNGRGPRCQSTGQPSQDEFVVLVQDELTSTSPVDADARSCSTPTHQQGWRSSCKQVRSFRLVSDFRSWSHKSAMALTAPPSVFGPCGELLPEWTQKPPTPPSLKTHESLLAFRVDRLATLCANNKCLIPVWR